MAASLASWIAPVIRLLDDRAFAIRRRVFLHLSSSQDLRFLLESSLRSLATDEKSEVRGYLSENPRTPRTSAAAKADLWRFDSESFNSQGD